MVDCVAAQHAPLHMVCGHLHVGRLEAGVRFQLPVKKGGGVVKLLAQAALRDPWPRLHRDATRAGLLLDAGRYRTQRLREQLGGQRAGLEAERRPAVWSDRLQVGHRLAECLRIRASERRHHFEGFEEEPSPPMDSDAAAAAVGAEATSDAAAAARCRSDAEQARPNEN